MDNERLPIKFLPHEKSMNFELKATVTQNHLNGYLLGKS